jgi:dethiobiotin synthetase
VNDPSPVTAAAARGLFVTATGTGAGKTFVTRALARALARRGLRVAALKPIETGCTPDPLDALALARACQRPQLAHDPAFYRVAAPLSPYAASLAQAGPAPDLERLASAIEVHQRAHDFTLVEGAGGLLVPLDARRTMADLMLRLALPLVLVAPNRLGVLSHVLTACECARARSLHVALVILSEPDPAPDPSTASNAELLAEHLQLPVHPLPFTRDDDDALATALEATPILDALHL